MYSKHQRRAALTGVILLLLLYVATLLSAIFDLDGSGNLFKACLFSSIAMPILLWVYIGLYGAITKKKTIASLFHEPEDLEKAKKWEEARKKSQPGTAGNTQKKEKNTGN